MALATTAPPYTRRRFTVAEYHAMAAAGILHEDDRIELIEGELVETAAPGGRHIRCVTILNKWLVHAVGDDAFVSVQGSIRLDERSEPEPDLVVLRSLPLGDAPPPSEDVLLLIEVSDTSLRYDRDIKVPLYARAGIPRVVLIDLPGEVVWRYSDPRGDAYRRIDRYSRGDRLVVEALPSRNIGIDVDDLFS